MPKLIVEEDGERRAYKLGSGRLTIGTGEEAKLRLRSPGVAAIHVDLEVSESGAVLHTRPGVQAPTVGGRPLPSQARLLPGQEVRIGSATLSLDAGVAAAPKAPAAGERRAVVSRKRKKTKKGLPTSVTLLILALIGGLGALAVSKAFSSTAASMQGVENQSSAIRIALKDSDYSKARRLLDALVADPDLTDSERDAVAEFAEEINAELAAANASNATIEGTEWFERFPKKYEGQYLQGEPSHAKIRTFLRLCAEFKELFPEHPENAWVDTQVAAWGRYASLEEPPSFKDVSWDIKYTLNRKPRDYRAAFKTLADFEFSCDGEDCDSASELREKLEEERRAYHEDRLQEARYEFEEKDNVSRASFWLISSITMLGDTEMEDEAARFYIRMPNFESTMRGLRRDQPQRFTSILENDVVRAAAKKLGIEE